MKRKTIWITCSLLVLLICLLSFSKLRSPSEESYKSEYFVRETGSEPAETTAPAPEPEPYVSPVDFEALWAVNMDVYAWLDIPGTEISYPLLQHAGDDTYYLRRNMKEENNSNGVIFTEASYNGNDFADSLTVVYGHNMNDGNMFGTLQEMYSSPENLEENSEIIIYLPNQELHYSVFAAVPFDNRHILYNYDFTDRRTFRLFFQEILSVRAIEAVYAENAVVRADEKTLILSTCLIGNRNKRFLVCGKLSHTSPQEINN